MAAQTVREVRVAEAEALVAGGKKLAPGIYAIPSRGVTVTVKPSTTPGHVRLIVTKGCAC
jgi:hypothetical protein